MEKFSLFRYVLNMGYIEEIDLSGFDEEMTDWKGRSRKIYLLFVRYVFRALSEVNTGSVVDPEIIFFGSDLIY